jgi:ABC-type transport system involved in cytochrome c biogenesis permease component
MVRTSVLGARSKLQERPMVYLPTVHVLWLTVREGVRSPFLPVLALAAAALTLFLPELVLFGFGDEARMVRELGHANIRIAVLLAVIFLAPGLAARDREGGLLATLLARPLRASHVLLGRYLGSCLVIGALLCVLSVALALALEEESAIALATGRAAAMAAALLAASMALATVLPAGLAAFATLGVFAAGHLHGYVRALLESGSPWLAWAFSVSVPDLEAMGVPLVGDVHVGAGAALGRAALTVVGFLALAAAIAEAREVSAMGDRP